MMPFMQLVFSILVLQFVSTVEIAPTQDEWTAPGVEAEELARIDLLAYGEPMNAPNIENSPHLACETFFVQSEDNVTWRVIIVYRDKLVILDQDQEPREIYPEYDNCRYAVFSPNGQYVLVGSELGAEDSPRCQYTLVNIEEGKTERFPRSFEYGTEPAFWIADDGSFALLPHARSWVRLESEMIVLEEIKDTLYKYNPQMELEWSKAFDATPTVRASYDLNRFVISDREGLSALDSSGSAIWETRTSDRDPEHSQSYATRLSADGSTLIQSNSGGCYQYNAESGSLLAEFYGYSIGSNYAISPSGSLWTATYKYPEGANPFDYSNIQYIITSSDNNNQAIITELVRNDTTSLNIDHIWALFNSGFKYAYDVSGRHSRVFVLDRSDQPIWISHACNRSIILFSGNVGVRWWSGCKPIAACEVNTGDYFVSYLDNGQLIISRITSE